jgi:hypothetical protein
MSGRLAQNSTQIRDAPGEAAVNVNGTQRPVFFAGPKPKSLWCAAQVRGRLGGRQRGAYLLVQRDEQERRRASWVLAAPAVILLWPRAGALFPRGQARGVRNVSGVLMFRHVEPFLPAVQR